MKSVYKTISLIVVILLLVTFIGFFAKDVLTNEFDVITGATANKFEDASVEIETDPEPLAALVPEQFPEERTFTFSPQILVEVTQEDYDKIMYEASLYEQEIYMLAKVIFREARGMCIDQQAAVAWNVLNRVDNPRFDSTIAAVITSPSQYAWIEDTPLWDEHINLAQDVIYRWLLEKAGYTNVGRVLPADYLYFFGYDGLNYYRTTWDGDTYWDWTWDSPYN